MRVVFDTNCLLQILGAKSRYAFLFDMFLQEKFTLCVSSDILLEYEEILKKKASALAADYFYEGDCTFEKCCKEGSILSFSDYSTGL